MPFKMLEIPFLEFEGTSALRVEKEGNNSANGNIICTSEKKIVPLRKNCVESDNIMRYLGSKDNIVGRILHLLFEKHLLRKEFTFFDAFCGMGSVSDSIKSSYHNIIINDLLHCSTTFTEGRLYANDCDFSSLGFDPFIYLNDSTESNYGFIYHNYSPGGSNRMYFSAENASKIDFIRDTIEHWYKNNDISEKEYKYLLACLLEAVSRISNTAGVYGAFLKQWDARALKPIVIAPLSVKNGNSEHISVFNEKIEEIIANVDCDILYLDPPYTQNQYGTQYHLLETLILQDNPPISAITGSRPTAPMRSDWSKMYYAHILFEKVVALTKAKHVIVSYNNDGIMTKDYIEKILKRYGIEETYQCDVIEYKKYNNFKCHGAENHVEYIFYIEKKPIDQVVIESPLNYTGSKAKMVNFIRQELPKTHINTFFDIFGGGFNVGINMKAERIIYNDINPFVQRLIKSFSTDTYKYLAYINKLIKQYKLAPDYKEGYHLLREKYNSIPLEYRDSQMLYTLILYGFQQQIRFNSDYEFNNPCGSRWFNDCLLSKFISFARCSRSKNIDYRNVNFEQLLPEIQSLDFVYADPPYRSTLGVYNDGKRGFEGWTIDHERKLCEFLDRVSAKGSKFMLSYVLKVDDFYNIDVENWANSHNYKIINVDATQGRYNNRNEVLIVNY